MSDALILKEAEKGVLALAQADGRELWRYTFLPTAPADESPRPVFHPLYSIDGDILTNFRPNDHPWHHGLSMTLTSVNGVNFWGGPSHRAKDSYQWRDDHGQQQHIDWIEKSPERLIQLLAWIDPQQKGAVVVEETRTLTTKVRDDGWTLVWTSRLTNPGSAALQCDNYHSLGGLAGSHYTGLQFRGARGLLDQHGDASIGFKNSAGQSTIDEVHGKEADWVEWATQHDGSLRRTKIKFDSPSGPIPWFIRPADPMVVFPPHGENSWSIPAGGSVELRHALHFDRL